MRHGRLNPRRLGMRAVCDACVRYTDDVRDVGQFGETLKDGQSTAECDRCGKPMASDTKAHFVKPAASRSAE